MQKTGPRLTARLPTYVIMESGAMALVVGPDGKPGTVPSDPRERAMPANGNSSGRRPARSMREWPPRSWWR